FLGLSSGCGHVSAWSFGHAPLLPIPVWGMLFFVALFALSHGPPRSARATTIVTWTGGAVAVMLLVAQAALVHAFCDLCIVADLATIGAAGARWVELRARPAGREIIEPRRVRLLGSVLAVAAMIAPLAWHRLAPTPPVPDVIRRLWEPGKLNVVEVVDFECRVCQRLHPAIVEMVNR